MARSLPARAGISAFGIGFLALALVAQPAVAEAAAAESAPANACDEAIAQAGTGQGVYGSYRLVLAPALGGSGSDVVLGTPGADRLSGGSGNDVLCGLGGDDLLDGGSGSDYLEGGAGNDQLFGGTGDDVLMGGAGRDVATGESGWDTCKAEAATCEHLLRSLGGVSAEIDFSASGTYPCQSNGTATCWGVIAADGLTSNEVVRVTSVPSQRVVATLTSNGAGHIPAGTRANIVCTGDIGPFVATSNSYGGIPTKVNAPC